MMTRDMIVFGEDWGAHPSSTQHLIRQFMRDRRVIWVNSLGLRAPRLDLRDGRRILRKLGDLARRSLHAGPPAPEPRDEGARPNRIIAPAALPLPGNAAAAAITRTLVSRQVKSAMQELDMERPVLWTSLPTAEPLLGAFDEHAVVYYAGDDFSALDGVDHEPVVELENRLADRAGLILAASHEIAARFDPVKTMVVPHGVDIDLFSRPSKRPLDLPVGRPVVGFYGNLSGWIDISLLQQAMRALQDIHFVFIGPVNADIEALKIFENAHFLGPRRHSDLPDYVQHFDCAILPFLDTPQIRACNPLKLREYLASGAPIASTDFPALEPYRSLIHVGTTPDSFIAAIEAALADKARANLRQRAVSNETWTRRAEDIAAVIDLI